jgi:hypothetical protein
LYKLCSTLAFCPDLSENQQILIKLKIASVFSPDLQQPSIQPASSQYQASIQPASRQHPASIQPASSRHQASIHPASSQHPASIQPASSQHPASIQPASSQHPPSIQPCITSSVIQASEPNVADSRSGLIYNYNIYIMYPPAPACQGPSCCGASNFDLLPTVMYKPLCTDSHIHIDLRPYVICLVPPPSLPSPGLSWALRGSPGLSGALLGSPELSRVLLGCPGLSRLYWALLESSRLSWAFLGCPGLSWALLGSLGLSWALLCSAGLSWALLGSPGLCWALQDSPGSPGLSWSLLGSPGLFAVSKMPRSPVYIDKICNQMSFRSKPNAPESRTQRQNLPSKVVSK